MKPIYFTQLETEKQNEIKRLLEHLIWHGCGGDETYIEGSFGMKFEEAVQQGLELKLVDLNYAMFFYAEDYRTPHADEQFQISYAARISDILRDAMENDEVPDFIYPNHQNTEEWER